MGCPRLSTKHNVTRDEVAETVGVGELEKQINDLIAKVALKLAAKEMLRDLKAIDLAKDPEWAKARAAAWEQEKPTS